MGSAGPGVFACVVDAHPKFHLDALRWFATLQRIAGVDAHDLVVHAVGSTESDVLAFLRGQGVSVVNVPLFDPRSPHCNKISGALNLAGRDFDGMAVLTDADIVVLEDPRGLPVAPGSLGLRLVGAGNPPLRVLEGVFASARLPVPERVPLERVAVAGFTLAGHGNGGVYMVPAATLRPVAQSWERWARWLLDRLDLLEDWPTFVDQTAMTLAVAETGTRPHWLDPRWNLPSQNPKRIPADPEPPAIIHYHHAVTNGGLLQETGFDAVDARIAAANEAITEVWHQAFPNASFWEWRYLINPERGSGVGSRGEPLEAKRRLLSAVVKSLQPTSVLDVGCGDGQATEGLALGSYVGIDLSAEAVRCAKLGRPDGDYRVGALADNRVEADLTMCLDVLIHQADTASYESLVSLLLGSCSRALLVSGYDRPPERTSPIVHFHEPLVETLRRLGPDDVSAPLREVHGITTYLVLKPSALPDGDDEHKIVLATIRDQIAARTPLARSRTRRGAGWLVRAGASGSRRMQGLRTRRTGLANSD